MKLLKLRTWAALGGIALAGLLLLAGCDKHPPLVETPAHPKTARYRGYGFWFQDLVARFQKEVNQPGQPLRYKLEKLPDFETLAMDFYQDTASMLSSVYPMTQLSFGARASEMLHAVDVVATSTTSVPEYASNGWLAPFDEKIYGPLLREAGIKPIRVALKGESEESAPIYGIPISRGADFLYYRKSQFKTDEQARQAWTAGMNGGFPTDKSPFIAADGQEFYRFFLGLVWSLEPNWPSQNSGTFQVNTPAAQQVMRALHRSVRLGSTATAANRMEYLSDLKNQFGAFTHDPTSRLPVTDWILSTWAQRLLVSSSGASIPLPEIGVLPLSASSDPTKPAYSLIGGKCIVCSRQLNSNDPGAADARAVVAELVRYLLSEKGQRTLCFDQFEIPARPDVLKRLTDADVAAVYAARREWLDYETFQNNLREKSLTLDAESLQTGRETLALLRNMEATLDNPARLVVRPNPLWIGQCMLMENQLHKILKPALAGTGSTLPPKTAEEAESTELKFVEDSLKKLQLNLEADQRFTGPPANPENGLPVTPGHDTDGENPEAK